MGKVASHPSAILLFVQLLGVLVYPYLETGGTQSVAFEIFGALVLALAIWATRESPGPTWIAVTLAVLASGLSIADEIHPVPAMDAASAVLHALFYFWAAASLMVYMLADRTVTSDELYAVGATFTLVAWGFAYVFELLQIFQPGSFIAAVDPDQPRTWMELLFLSFTNLSSTGLSDVVPVTAQARSVGDDRAGRRSWLCRAIRLAAGRPDHRVADDLRQQQATRKLADGAALARGRPRRNTGNTCTGVRPAGRAGSWRGSAAQGSRRVMVQRPRTGLPDDCGAPWRTRRGDSGAA